jgi:hypothetical protein
MPLLPQLLASDPAPLGPPGPNLLDALHILPEVRQL